MTAERKSPRMIERARALRGRSTPPEQRLWSALRGRRLEGLKFRRQHPIGPYVVDFFCEEKRIIVELDGTSHEDKWKEDLERTRYLEQRGLHVFRVTNSDVKEDLEAVVRGIAREAGVEFR